ncbi:MAG: PorV/PorQ family protein [candidate division Zixibacteria bacterium]|nr:PorV/PorQ family protein [candidate division Zixibacteria bacterium]
MKKALVTILAILMIAGIASEVNAQVSRAGVIFLLLPPGARASGMGDAFTSIADDATATYWNPAGLGRYPLSPAWFEFRVKSNNMINEEDVQALSESITSNIPEDYYAEDVKYSIRNFLEAWENLTVDEERFVKLQAIVNESLVDSSISTLEFNKIILAIDNSIEKIREIAVMENGMPDHNYGKYDTWTIIDNKLAKFADQEWVDGETYYPSPGEEADDIIRRFSDTTDEDSIATLKPKLASYNNNISKEDLEALSESIIANIPEDYSYAEDAKYSLGTLLEAWDNLTIDKERFAKLQSTVNESLSDSSISTLELDRITFAINNSVRLRLPEEVYIPYNFILPDSITTIASDTKNLWVGTPVGLFKYNGRRWTTYTTADSLISNDITAIAFGARQEIWIGTPEGISRYKSRKWTSYTTENGLPDNKITGFAVGPKSTIWVNTDKGLARLKGNGWEYEAKYPLNVGEDISKIVAKYFHIKPGPIQDALVDEINAHNSLGDSIPETGTEIKIPFSLAVRGEVKSLFIDKENNLWVASTEGLINYNGESWTFYGYKEYTAKQGDTAGSIAEFLLGNKASESRIAFLNERISKYNDLTNHPIEAGDIIYVYATPLAADITSLGAGSVGHIMVGTKFGTFRRSGEEWKSYDHAGLEKEEMIDIIEQDGEVWMVTEDKLVVHAHAMREMSFMHSNWLVQLADDLYFEYLSYVQHLEGIGTMGAAMTFLSYGSQERTDEFQNSLGTFASYEFAVAVSYGARVSNDLSLGMNAKYINSHLSDVGAGAEKGSGVASSFAIDGGMLWDTPVNKLRMGLTINNIGPDISYIDAAQADPLPRNLIVSFAYRIVDNPYNKLTIIGEASKQLIDLTKFNRDSFTDKMAEKIEEVIAHIGAEYWYGTFLALRTGFVNDKAGQQRYYTLGAGLQYQNYRFDFSYIPSTNEDFNRLGNTMRFSMTARF